MCARLARSTSTCTTVLGVGSPQSSRTLAAIGISRKIRFSFSASALQAPQILAGNSDLNRYTNRLAGFEAPSIDDRSGNLAVKLRLQAGQ